MDVTDNEFKHLMIGGLPFMSLPENERHPQQLTQHLLRHLSQQGLCVQFTI